jgi:NTE family protein
VFPGGFFTMDEGRRRFEEELPEEWPDQALWLCAVDIVAGRRVVLGRPGAPTVSLRRAVLASCAIPGLYEPVQVGRRTLVDGGAYSTTNLDLAVKDGCDVIIGVAPLAFETATPPGPIGQLVRRIPARAFAGEVAYARRKGAEVLMIRPSAREVRVHGLNMMRPSGLEHVAQAAYDETATLVATDSFQDVLGRLPAA